MTEIPQQVRLALSMMEQAGFEAYIVGGCVRDFLLGRKPADFDITTNALPDQTQEVFKNFKCIDIGKKHGTIAVMIDKMQIEITTYRIDGEYSDKRHPESVEFSSNLSDDLSRRDFTINAMAYNEKTGTADCFGGKQDLEAHIIRCVGEPEKRFDEDALRIIRAIRFAAQLDFEIEPATKKCIFELKDTLKLISAERLRTELQKLLMGKAALKILLEYHEVLEVFIPEIAPCIGFDQHSRYHEYDVWEHISRSVINSIDNLLIRTVMLFHDIAKPACFMLDERGVGHFKEHPEKGAEMALDIMKRLKYDNKSIKEVTALIKYHDVRFRTKQDIKKVMSATGRELFFKLIDVQNADALSKDGELPSSINDLDWVRKTAEEIIADGDCLCITEMDIKGEDLMAMGISGQLIGKTLSYLLGELLEDRLENRHDVLAEAAKAFYSDNI